MQEKLPKIFVLYGPPAAGKGTQASLLTNYLKDYIHFDIGAELREFVNKNIGDYKEETITKKIDLADKNIQIALKAKEAMIKGEAVETEVVWYIVEKQITNAINNGKGLIIEGIGRTFEDCRRLSQIAIKDSLSVCIFHLYISVEESIRRSKSRFYINSNPSSFKTLEEALKNAKPGEQPWQRSEDKDENKIRARYEKLYQSIFAKALSTLQMESLARLFIIDGHDTIEEDFLRIKQYLAKFYDYKSQ
jgi:adenylate kinase family enzyme